MNKIELTNELISQIQKKVEDDIRKDIEFNLHEFGNTMAKDEEQKLREEYFQYYKERAEKGLTLGGNKKNKPKIYKNKIIQGKERNIYKIPGSRKDYIKYKGAFIAVKDFIKNN